MLNILKTSFDFVEELSDMRKQMKALEEKNVTYMKETMNLQEVYIDFSYTMWSSLVFDYK